MATKLRNNINPKVREIVKDIEARIEGRATIKETFSTPLGRILKLWGQELNEEIGRQLSTVLVKGRKRSDLQKSFSLRNPKISAKTVEIDSIAAYYWQYIEYGVNGIIDTPAPGSPFKYEEASKTRRHPLQGPKTFQQAVKNWVPRAKVKPNGAFMMKHRNSSSEQLYNSWAFAIRNSIMNRGQKPKPFVDKALSDEVKNEFSKILLEVTGVPFDVVIRKPEIKTA